MQTNARVTAASVIQQQMEENADQWKREVEARQRRQTKARRQRIEERQRLKHLYRHETLEQKVSRMASHC
ncbi:MAG TPA: hypothetical protein P5330_10055 [Candidatus Competibacteraceae bacterium]|nr:hypothetical protein [Candidatus Competibacteraceae bacterium]